MSNFKLRALRHCATVGFTSVESANVVGYQDKAADNATGYTWMTATFEKVDGDTISLKDFAIKENLLVTAMKVYLLDKAGATAVDEGGRKLCFKYMNATRAGATYVPGWYYDSASTQDMKDGKNMANDFQIPYGQGIGVYRGTTAATLVFSGAVANEDKEVQAVNATGYTWTGNVMPVDLKLSDLTFKENLLVTAAKIYLLDKAGATAVDEGTRKLCFKYMNPTRAGSTYVPGWYYDSASTQDMKDGKNMANDFVIKAGQGFGVYRGTTAATLIVPSPLVDAE